MVIYNNLVAEKPKLLLLSVIDELKFQKVFRAYYNPLCNYAASIVNDRRLAQDVVQDVFTHLWAKRDSLQVGDDEKSYLFVAVKNKAIEKLRKKVSDAEVSQVLKLMAEHPVQQQAEKYVLREQINNSIRQLPPKCQEVFRMSKINGLTYSEIAEELEISVKTVENHIGKAYRLLREMLAGKTEATNQKH